MEIDINAITFEDIQKELEKEKKSKKGAVVSPTTSTEIKGIGLKVASCILLFGFRRLDVFPIDTWVKQTISTKYKIKNDTKTIEKFAKEKYGVYSALAIQYMFHYGRNVKKENESC